MSDTPEEWTTAFRRYVRKNWALTIHVIEESPATYREYVAPTNSSRFSPTGSIAHGATYNVIPSTDGTCTGPGVHYIMATYRMTYSVWHRVLRWQPMSKICTAPVSAMDQEAAMRNTPSLRQVARKRAILEARELVSREIQYKLRGYWQ